MLTRLIVQHYAIISSLDLSFGKGMSVITGETGAGKSILLGALGLALGKRADLKVLPDDQSKCIVEAYFSLHDDSLKKLFEQEDLDFDRQLICRREIAAGGRSRSFINDTPVTLKTLQDITSCIIELHHQHDSLALQSRDYQVEVLDTISGAQSVFSDYTTAYSKFQAERHELHRLHDLEASSARRRDFLEFQLQELREANLTVGEITSLESTQLMLENAEAIRHAVAAIQSAMQDNPQAISTQITSLLRLTEPVHQAFTPLADIVQRLEAMRIEAQDLAMETDRLDLPDAGDPAMLERVQSRLNLLYRLIKKYQCTDEAELIAARDHMEKELAALSSVSDDIRRVEKNLADLDEQVLALAEKLSATRKKGAKKMLPRVAELLTELGMPNARFEVGFQQATSPGQTGIDDITFLFSASKGMSLQPLHAVASGGELSRLSLVLKSIYAQQAELPVMIFDEIDTGISGEVAWRMGQLIRQMSKGQQIIMITHSPQIAAHADTQYHVSKSTEGIRDTSHVELLDSSGRTLEIAKMLGGETPSKAAVANAKSLLQDAASGH